MNLDEFLELKPWQGQHIKYPKFTTLYVRWSRLRENCIELASMEARRPGSGALTDLLEDLIGRGINIYVENVLTTKLQLGLERRGFERMGNAHDINVFSYYLGVDDE